LNRARIIRYDVDGNKCGFRISYSVGKWRSPEEQLDLPLTHKIDLFSMSFVFWAVLTGNIPFARLSVVQAKQAVMAGGRPPLSPTQCGAGSPSTKLLSLICKLIRSSWASDPTARPEASSVRRQLGEAIQRGASL
jgi:hypothetical protein